MTYMVVDVATGNAIAAFQDPDEARSCLFSLAEGYPTQAGDLAIVSFDKDGYAVASDYLADLRESV